jgi:ABC-type branched-subunit amino acid transport system ATPase component
MVPLVLAVRDLDVHYGAVRALSGVSVDLPDRGVVAVLGSNGAGKSTLLRAVAGGLRALGGTVSSGAIEFDGRRIDGLPPAAVVDAGIVLVPEGRQIFTRLTVDENLRIGAFSRRDRGARAATRERILDLFPILYERRQQRAGLLSGGQQQMLAIGRALMAAPRVLLLDEPSLGLAPLMVGQIGEVIREINAGGTAVLLVEQNATMALGIATDAVVLTVGEVSLTGAASDLMTDARVRHLYLGGAREDDADVDAADERIVAVAATGRRVGRPHLGRWVG